MPAMLNWPRQSIGGGCQSSKMAALLNSLSFAFTNSFDEKRQPYPGNDGKVRNLIIMGIGSITQNAMGKIFSIRQLSGPEHP